MRRKLHSIFFGASIVLLLSNCGQPGQFWENWNEKFTPEIFRGKISSSPIAEHVIDGAKFTVYHQQDADSNKLCSLIKVSREGHADVIYQLFPHLQDKNGKMKNKSFLAIDCFRKHYRFGDGYKLYFSCHWDAGSEAGILYLDKDFRINQYGLSW